MNYKYPIQIRACHNMHSLYDQNPPEIFDFRRLLDILRKTLTNFSGTSGLYITQKITLKTAKIIIFFFIVELCNHAFYNELKFNFH